MQRTAAAMRGACRATWAVASLTIRELVRSGTVLLAFVFFLFFVAAFRTDMSLELQAASARFLNYTLGGLSVLLLFLGVFLALQLAGRGEHFSQQAFLLRRTVSPQRFFWGRAGGLTAVLVLLGLMASVLILVHHSVRYGGAGTFSLETRISGEGFSSTRDTRILRRQGDRAVVPFDVEGRIPGEGKGRFLLRGRLAPVLVLVAESGGARSSCPLLLEVTDEAGSWKRRTRVRIHEGRAVRFSVELPPGLRPDKLLLTLENRSGDYLVKFRRDDLQLTTGRSSFAAGVMKGALVLALFASVLGVFVLFFRLHMAVVPSLMASLGVVLLSVAVDVFEFGVFASFSLTLREALVAAVTTMLPDGNRFDAVDLLSRGVDVPWGRAGELLLRLFGGGVLLGFLDRWTTRRRGMA